MGPEARPPNTVGELGNGKIKPPNESPADGIWELIWFGQGAFLGRCFFQGCIERTGVGLVGNLGLKSENQG